LRSLQELLVVSKFDKKNIHYIMKTS